MVPLGVNGAGSRAEEPPRGRAVRSGHRGNLPDG
jgi:hypothetical protein